MQTYNTLLSCRYICNVLLGLHTSSVECYWHCSDKTVQYQYQCHLFETFYKRTGTSRPDELFAIQILTVIRSTLYVTLCVYVAVSR